MNEVSFVIFFIFGLIFGSFFNVVGIRVPRKELFIHERSKCPACKHTLHWSELIPIVSFILQKGKCKHCSERISNIYPLIEGITGLLFAISYIKFGLNWELLIALIFISMLMIVTVSDIRYMVIPNRILFFYVPIFIFLRIVHPLHPWWSFIIGGIVGYVVVAIIILISKGGMGAGDMKLLAVSGIVLGVKNVLLAFFIASLTGAVIGGFLLLLKKIEKKQPIPFGPYIVIGVVVAYFYGDSIIGWYAQML